VFRRIRVVVVAVIGVVGLRVTLRNLIARVLVVIPVVVVVLATPRLMCLLFFTLKVSIREMARWSFRGLRRQL
jgi:hypothetical protein